MKRFRFRLERVLAVRRVQEEIARAAWSEREHAARRAQSALDGARSSLVRAVDELSARLERETVDPDAVLLEGGAVDALQRRIPPAKRQAQAARDHAERERRAWAERKSALESLNKLREHARRAHLRTLEVEEARMLDEQASNRARRRAREAS